MKKLRLIMTAVLAVLMSTVIAQELPKPSPSATWMQEVGVTKISMDYSRPSVKGRTIWGDLVAYDKVWRAGANASTKIEFSTDVKINGVDVKAGKYALFIIPAKEGDWTFIISNYTEGWGVDGYTEASDVVRVKATPAENAMTESLMFSIDNITDNSAMISMSWEKVKVGFTVEINTDEFAMQNLEAMVKEADRSFRTYNSAARYYLEKGMNDKALAMAQKSCEQTKKFWNLTVLSECYAATGDMKMAMKVAEEALEMSKAADYAPYVSRNEKNMEEWGKKKK